MMEKIDNRKQAREERDDKIINLYKSGKSSNDIEREFGYSQSVVLNAIHKYEKETGDIITRSSVKYDVNLDYFKEIDTEAKAYFLGYIAADGCNNQGKWMSLALHKKDVEIVESLKKECGYTGPLIVWEKTNQIKLIINRSEFVKNLENHGIVQRKTYCLKFPKHLRNDLVRHFVRGYFDGDGTHGLTKNKKEIKANIVAAVRPILEELKTVIEREANISCSIGKKKTYNNGGKINYCLFVSGNNNAIKFLDWLYEDSNFFLSRKKNAYMEAKKYINENIRRMPYRRPVQKISDNGDVIETYPSTVAAGKANNLFHQNIRACCLGLHEKIGGFKWRFVDQVEKSNVV